MAESKSEFSSRHDLNALVGMLGLTTARGETVHNFTYCTNLHSGELGMLRETTTGTKLIGRRGSSSSVGQEGDSEGNGRFNVSVQRLREIERDRSADRGLFVDELLLMAFKALSVLARRHKGVDNTSSTQEGDNGAKHSLGVRVGSEGAMTEGSPVSGDVVEHGSCDSRSGLV
jgi:hypothetical protein